MFTYCVDSDTFLQLMDMRHAEANYRLIDANRDFFKPWFAWVQEVDSAERFAGYIKFFLNEYVAGKRFPVEIWHEGQLAGCLSLENIDKVNRSATVAYYLGESFTGKGLLTKSLQAVFDYAFTELNLNRIEIRCGVENVKSRAVPERLGFKEEGLIREAEWLYDHFVDHAVYGMLAKEWKSNGEMRG